MLSLGKIIDTALVVWLQSDIYKQHKLSGAIATELGESLIPIKDLSEEAIRCYLDCVEESDPQLDGGVIWIAEKGFLGIDIASTFAFIDEWQGIANKCEVWISNNNKLEVSSVGGKIKIQEKWGGKQYGVCEQNEFDELLNQTSDEICKFKDRLLSEAEKLHPNIVKVIQDNVNLFSNEKRNQ